MRQWLLAPGPVRFFPRGHRVIQPFTDVDLPCKLFSHIVVRLFNAGKGMKYNHYAISTFDFTPICSLPNSASHPQPCPFPTPRPLPSKPVAAKSSLQSPSPASTSAPPHDQLLDLFLGATIVFQNDTIAYLQYDDEYHRIALFADPNAQPQLGGSKGAGVHHVTFTFASLADLVRAYKQRKALGVLPTWCVDHG